MKISRPVKLLRMSLASALVSVVVGQIPAINSVTIRAVRALPDPGPIVVPSPVPDPPVPASVAVPPSGENFRIWIYDPRNPSVALGSSGIFISPATGPAAFQFVAEQASGALFLRLNPGQYVFDVVEPPSLRASMTRLRYAAAVSVAGVVSINGKTADARGFFAVTVTVVNTVSREKLAALTAVADEPALTFVPTSEFQLLDQVTPNRGLGVDLSAGFPRVRWRLPVYGRLRALIVPVDFAEIPGIDSPVTFFTPIADAVRDFYFGQSYGRLAMDFEILPQWLRLPFPAGKYNLGRGVGSGDPNGYRAEIVALTEPLIDYSQYDAVYFLPPKEVPLAAISSGPAITFPIPTKNGYIVNGASGGADMYLVGNGPNAARNWMAHETGHAFGLYDEDLDHASATLGSWGLMANSWSTTAIELGGWDRFLLGWLDQSQIAGLPLRTIGAGGTTVKLNPLVRQNAEIKVALIPLGISKILVLESRKGEGLDGTTGNRIPPNQEGVLVYTVDMKLGQLKGGYRTQRRNGSTDASFRDAALRTGDEITVEGVEITVLELGGSGDTVRVRLVDPSVNVTPGRLANLSVLAPLAPAGDSLTLGYVVNGASAANAKPLVIRAAGPSLGALGVAGTLTDPQLELFAGSAKTLGNDDWGGLAATQTAMSAVGAFPYSGPMSRDAAVVASITSSDNSVKVSAGPNAAAGTGSVIAEVYDASPPRFDPTTPELINFSVLKDVRTSVTMGFVLGGVTHRTVLVRAIGPTLGIAAFNIGGVMADPKVELFDAASKRIWSNDNWGGGALANAFTQTGAFQLPATSKDSAFVVTLPPGNYSVVVTPATGTASGAALLEVYALP
jgi:M6 family metalloprotease-like protein